MALCTLFKRYFLSWSSEFLANYEILLDIRVRNLGNKLIIIRYQVIELLIDIRIVLKLIYPAHFLLPWRVPFFIIVLINLMLMRTWWCNFIMIHNWDFNVLQE